MLCVMPRAAATTSLPSVFISHGAPTFALAPGRIGPQLTNLGQRLPRPEAVLVVSPHWMSHELFVGTVAQPETIHDFGGFPAELYRLRYDAPGHPVLARRALDVLNAAGFAPRADDHRGLDHGAWVPMMHLYPQADVPVFQVSLPATLDGDSAWALGRALAPLSREGVLIVGSGSLTHNLYEVRLGSRNAEPYAQAFVDWVRNTLAQGDNNALRAIMQRAPHAARAHPTAEHLWPLLIAAGAASALDRVELLDGGMEHGVLSMDAFVFG
jgi:4,5-DOPA dioxygenase extradiol